MFKHNCLLPPVDPIPLEACIYMVPQFIYAIGLWYDPRKGVREIEERLCDVISPSEKHWALLGNEENPIDEAPQTNPDTWPRSEPTLELHSRAASSVGITSPFQRSQHRKQFQRKADKKNGNLIIQRLETTELNGQVYEFAQQPGKYKTFCKILSISIFQFIFVFPFTESDLNRSDNRQTWPNTS